MLLLAASDAESVNKPSNVANAEPANTALAALRAASSPSELLRIRKICTSLACAAGSLSSNFNAMRTCFSASSSMP